MERLENRVEEGQTLDLWKSDWPTTEIFAYKFIKFIRTLRMSPAMAAGVSDRLSECGRFGSSLGSLRAAEGGKSGLNEYHIT